MPVKNKSRAKGTESKNAHTAKAGKKPTPAANPPAQPAPFVSVSGWLWRDTSVHAGLLRLLESPGVMSYYLVRRIWAQLFSVEKIEAGRTTAYTVNLGLDVPTCTCKANTDECRHVRMLRGHQDHGSLTI